MTLHELQAKCLASNTLRPTWEELIKSAFVFEEARCDSYLSKTQDGDATTRCEEARAFFSALQTKLKKALSESGLEFGGELEVSKLVGLKMAGR